MTHVVLATTGRQPAAGRSSASQSGTTRTLIREDGGVIRRTTLPSGLRVITERVPGQRSATIGVWVGVGSRDESPALHGCSHFLEHLLFKGTAERSALDISIEDDGTVYIGATDGPSAEAARAAINAIANPHMPSVGERFVGTVVKTTTFGAFVSLSPGKDGLLHISQIRKLVGGKRVENVEDVLAVGQKVQVEIGEIDPRGKLSLHAVLDDEVAAAPAVEDASAVEDAPVDVPAND